MLLQPNYYDLTTQDISSLLIEKIDAFSCVIKDSNWNTYQGFLLGKSPTWSALTVCDIDFHPWADWLYKPRIVLRRTNKEYIDKSVPLNSITQRISLQNSDDWCDNFWTMVSFLRSFREIIDLGSFEKTYQAITREQLESLLYSNEQASLLLESIGTNQNPEVISSILSKICWRKDFFDLLQSSDITDIDFNGILWITKLQRFIQVREENKENDQESFWQSFFEENVRILQQIFSYATVYLNWETYVWGKNTKWRQWQWWVSTDFLLKLSICWSFAVIDIKNSSDPSTLMTI
jgi:hypothetical protein